MTRQFLVKSTPQIVEIIDSVLKINECQDRSLLVHQLLLPYIIEVIMSDNSEINDVERVSDEIYKVFDSYYQEI